MKKAFVTSVIALTTVMCTGTISAQDQTYVSEGVSIGKTENGNGLSLNVNGLILEITDKVIDSNNDNSTSEYSFSYKHKKPRRRYESKVSSAEFGFNHFTTSNYALYPDHPGFMDMRMGRSFHYAANLFEAGTGIDRMGIIGLSTALRLTWNQLFFDGPYSITYQDGKLQPVELGDRIEKSKLKTWGVQVPLYLDLNIKKASISLGGYGGIIISSKTKMKSPKVKDNMRYVNPFEYGLSARLAWDEMSLFVNYPLSNFFEDNRGLDSRMITVGIGF